MLRFLKQTEEDIIMLNKKFLIKTVTPNFGNNTFINNDIISFFETIWKNKGDQEGYFVLWEKETKNTYSFHINELHLAAQMADSLKSQTDVYFSVGLQKNKQDMKERGVEKNVVSIPGLWFDFDLWNEQRTNTRTKEEYPPDMEMLLRVIDDYLPTPSVLLETGGGLHAFWLFDTPILISSEADLKEAKALTQKWHNRMAHLGNSFGWHFDNVSSIEHLMRISGTLNHKYAVTVRTIDQPVIYYSKKIMTMHAEGLLETYPQQEIQPVREIQEEPLNPELTNLINTCSFLKHCEQDAATLPEPEWHMMTCILANEKDGAEGIHHLSKGYPQYSFVETEKKIQNARDKNPGPITCEHLKTLWDCGKDCEVTSPIHLLKRTDIHQVPIIKNPFMIQNKDDEENELDAEMIESTIVKDKVPDTTFPWTVFPETVAVCLKDLAQAISVNEDMTAVIALAVLSSAIGSAVRYIESKEGYTVPISIWLGIIGETGHKKTPVLEKMLRPVYEYQKNLFTQFKSPANSPQATQGQVSQSGNSPSNPLRAASIFTTDPTLEALMVLLCENEKGILLFQDELTGFLQGFNKYRSGKGGDREQYLSLWSSTPIKVDRVSKQLYCHRPSLSLLGGLQPRKAASVFGEKSFDDGFLPRFLFYQMPNKRFPLTDHKWAPVNEKLWKDMILKFYTLKPESLILKLDPEAWKEFMVKANSLQRLGEYVPARLRVFIPKLENYILRLSGLLHMLSQWDKEPQNISQTIPASTVRQAIKLIHFFLGQARKVVELYGPRKISLNKNQEVVVDSILILMKKFNTNSVAVSHIMDTFNSLVPDEGKIKSLLSFGALLVKILKVLDIKYTKARKSKADGSMGMHLEVPEPSVKKLLLIQKTYN